MNLVLGTMNIEYPYSSNKDRSILKYKNIIYQYFLSCDNPIFDTAYYYGNTTTEIILGRILKDFDHLKYKIATKANPWYNNDFTNNILGQLSPFNLEFQLNTSLKNLQLEKVDIFYLHCYDYDTPITKTLEKCDSLWRKEKFDYLGISNFSKTQLLEVLNVCENHSYNKPRYYQGMYNLISRKIEELFPIFNQHYIEFWGYNPLAGGLLTGKYKNKELKDDSRFKNNQIYQNIFWKEPILDNLEDFFNLENPTEYSFQWLKKYSKLRENDKIILGVSSIDQLNNNLNIIKNNVNYEIERINFLNNIYSKIENYSPNYYY